ncbi:tryptophan 2-C-methyltransferase [Microbispora triticiradicis]|uniref:tryptophan 2-C-methyltransferase n=1 Tax=Microbispora triticiradicis TaxID=2200763 RepID=UPI00244DBF14|nr:tryptophan 2-C-methyltransferase [Microbispora triticiradicis]
MSKGTIALINPNKVHPPIAPYALDVLSTALEMAGFTAEVVDLTFCRDDWRSVLAEYFTDRRPILTGITVRNTDTVYVFDQRPFVVEHKEIVTEIRRHVSAPIVVGGVGFSTMPFSLMEYFGVEFGVKGPGERIVCELAQALAESRSPREVTGLLVNDAVWTDPPPACDSPLAPEPRNVVSEIRNVTIPLITPATPYIRRSGMPLKVDNRQYYRQGGLGSILTKNGCPFSCSHCVEPDAKGARLAHRHVDAVVDEMESLIGQGIHDLHTTDSEFNLGIAHSKRVLREIVRRKESSQQSPLHKLRLWVYCQPSPFDEEFAELLAAAGCAGVNVGADHVRKDLLDGWKVTAKGTRYYGSQDVGRLVKLCQAYGIKTMVEALFGMPGETRETMRECVEEFMALEATVTAFSLGLRLFPYIPLARRLAAECDGVRTVPGLQSDTARGPIVLRPLEQCANRAEYERQFMFDEDGRLRLVCYISPSLANRPEAVGYHSDGWHDSVRFLWDCVPRSEHYRVMLPTVAGNSEHDNNYADNPFLVSLRELGYTGAFWAHWPHRDSILARVRAMPTVEDAG